MFLFASIYIFTIVSVLRGRYSCNVDIVGRAAIDPILALQRHLLRLFRACYKRKVAPLRRIVACRAFSQPRNVVQTTRKRFFNVLLWNVRFLDCAAIDTKQRYALSRDRIFLRIPVVYSRHFYFHAHSYFFFKSRDTDGRTIVFLWRAKLDAPSSFLAFHFSTIHARKVYLFPLKCSLYRSFATRSTLFFVLVQVRTLNFALSGSSSAWRKLDTKTKPC